VAFVGVRAVAACAFYILRAAFLQIRVTPRRRRDAPIPPRPCKRPYRRRDWTVSTT
jgi:hypothetical protein